MFVSAICNLYSYVNAAAAPSMEKSDAFAEKVR